MTEGSVGQHGSRTPRSLLRFVFQGLALLAFVATLAAAFRTHRGFAASSAAVEHTMLVKTAIADLKGTLAEAETGQRGYVLMGRGEYLKPYTLASPRAREEVTRLRHLTADNAGEQALLDDVERLVSVKMVELQQVIDARDHEGQSAALTVIATDLGLHTMEAMVAKLDQMGTAEDALLEVRLARQRRFESLVIASLALAGVVLGLFATIGVLLNRTAEAQRRLAQSDAARLRAENDVLAERERTAQFQETFIAVLGHDLRNPLSAMTMGLKYLRGCPPSKHAATIDRLERSAARMARMISQLLDLARSRLGGGIPVQSEATNLGSIVTDVADEARAAHPERSVLVETAGDLNGEWDRDRLAQVVSNLVENAISHGSSDAPVSVVVRGEGDTVTFGVHNVGPAIPEATARWIFEPFRRGDRDGNAPGAAGLGLGLYITREIVGAHGGRVDLTSNDSSGITFTVELPRTTRARQGENQA
jgi:signal transduction histidine kinase